MAEVEDDCDNNNSSSEEETLDPRVQVKCFPSSCGFAVMRRSSPIDPDLTLNFIK